MSKDFRYDFITTRNVCFEKDNSGNYHLCFSAYNKAYDLKLIHPFSLIQHGKMIKEDEFQKQLTVGQVDYIAATKVNYEKIGQAENYPWVEISQNGITTRIDCKNIDGLS